MNQLPEHIMSTQIYHVPAHLAVEFVILGAHVAKTTRGNQRKSYLRLALHDSDAIRAAEEELRRDPVAQRLRCHIRALHRIPKQEFAEPIKKRCKNQSISQGNKKSGHSKPEI